MSLLGPQKRTLYLRHRLHLVTTSHECSHVAKEIPRSAQQTMEEGDAMAASPSQAEAVQQDLMVSSQRSVPAMEVGYRSALAPAPVKYAEFTAYVSETSCDILLLRRHWKS